ncbi:MAG TPA: hypothetical protein VF714_12150, partial [Jatrophihabitans sp.]
MTHSNPGPDQPEYQGPPLPHAVPPYQVFPHEVFPPEVYLQPPPPPPAAKGSPVKKVIAGVAVLAVLAGGAVAAYAYTVLASSGIQPERVLPANTVA